MAGSEQGQWTSELLVLAMALAALAWLTLVLGLRWQRRTKAVAALPSLATVHMALVVAIGDAANGEDDLLPGILLLAIELSALIAFAVIWAWQPEVRSLGRELRLMVALWGTTAFGIFHQMFEYMIMIRFSERNWGFAAAHRVPHGRSHHDLRHPDCDHDPTHPTDGRCW
jgi:hypothetical protein